MFLDFKILWKFKECSFNTFICLYIEMCVWAKGYILFDHSNRQ